MKTKIPSEHETVLIIGNQASFAFLQSFGSELKHTGNRLIYTGIFENKDEVYCQEEIEKIADAVIWVTQTGEPITPTRPEDYSIANIDAISALLQYADQHPALSLADIDRIFIIGNTELMRRFQAARSTTLKPHLIKDPKVVGAVYGNMQCMLKGVCAQCLQWQIDPETGKRTKAVFACSWQDQPLEIIDIDHIDERAMQNRLLDKLSNVWIDHIFKENAIARV